MICLVAYCLLRICRRTRELHQIQEALEREHVKPPFFSYDDLKTATRNFSHDNVLGKEMVNITGIKHRNPIQFLGCCVREKQQRMLVYEFAENRSLAEALCGREKVFVLSWEQRLQICVGIARGLAYLHEELQPKMIHRDIKPQNILLGKDYNAKIADFGLVRPAHTDATQVTLIVLGTKGHLSPEYATEGVVSEKLDVYSFGIALLEIVSGRLWFSDKTPAERNYLRDWALALYEDGKLLDLVDEDLMGACNQEEVRLVLKTALSCCQAYPKNCPSMSQAMNLFMKHEDLAFEIVKELRGNGTGLGGISEDHEEPRISSESEERSFVSRSESRSHLSELTEMRPRQFELTTTMK
ncbi:hypothetical protein MPTK2_4g18760 [Marchantia polymorpha subsp. ruderalis]